MKPGVCVVYVYTFLNWCDQKWEQQQQTSLEDIREQKTQIILLKLMDSFHSQEQQIGTQKCFEKLVSMDFFLPRNANDCLPSTDTFFVEKKVKQQSRNLNYFMIRQSE